MEPHLPGSMEPFSRLGPEGDAERAGPPSACGHKAPRTAGTQRARLPASSPQVPQRLCWACLPEMDAPCSLALLPAAEEPIAPNLAVETTHVFNLPGSAVQEPGAA